MILILEHIHTALIIITTILGIMSVAKKGFIKSMSTIYVYVFIGTIFEIALKLNDGNKGGGFYIGVYLYPLIFPTCVSMSVLIRLFDSFIKKIIIYLTIMAILFVMLDNSIFLAINYLIALSGIAITLIAVSQKKSLKWHHLIDALFALNLFQSSIIHFMDLNLRYWNDSVYVDYFFFFYNVPVTFLYYLLINVKFWRSITR
jgi:hypothetical protein